MRARCTDVAGNTALYSSLCSYGGVSTGVCASATGVSAGESLEGSVYA